MHLGRHRKAAWQQQTEVKTVSARSESVRLILYVRGLGTSHVIPLNQCMGTVLRGSAVSIQATPPS